MIVVVTDEHTDTHTHTPLTTIAIPLADGGAQDKYHITFITELIATRFTHTHIHSS